MLVASTPGSFCQLPVTPLGVNISPFLLPAPSCHEPPSVSTWPVERRVSALYARDVHERALGPRVRRRVINRRGTVVAAAVDEHPPIREKCQPDTEHLVVGVNVCGLRNLAGIEVENGNLGYGIGGFVGVHGLKSRERE